MVPHRLDDKIDGDIWRGEAVLNTAKTVLTGRQAHICHSWQHVWCLDKDVGAGNY